MEITQEHRQNIEHIIEQMQNQGIECLKNFECYTSSLDKLCKIKGIGAFGMLECYSADAEKCGLSFVALSKHFCRCPLRKYIAASFHK
jgi:hypothetical protein